MALVEVRVPLSRPTFTTKQAVNCTLEKIKSTPNRRFMKSHANLKELPVGRAKGLKVGSVNSHVLVRVIVTSGGETRETCWC